MMKIRNGENSTWSVSLAKNDYTTPIEAWDLLVRNMRDIDITFWLPFYNDGSIKRVLEKRFAMKVIHKNKDFFKYEPKSYDVLVDNPPYVNKFDIITRCKQLGKPFALLIPMETLERHYIGDMFKSDSRLQVIIPKKRYEFENVYSNSKGRIPFKTVWFCWNMNLKTKNNRIFE